MILARVVLPALLVTSLAGLARPDRITLVDGTELDDVEIEAQTLNVVRYDGGTVPSDQVRSVTFKKLPDLVDEALAALRGGDAGLAADLLDEYVDDRSGRGDRQHPWGPAYAAWTAIELRQQYGDLPGVVEKAGAFPGVFPDSRYVPLAFLAKATAQHQMEDSAAVAATLESFRSVISEKSLSARWSLEADLFEARTAAGSLATKRDALESIASRANEEHLAVAVRARVAIAEAILAEADKNSSDQAKAASLREEARGILEEVVENPAADAGALAGAYTGLGEALFYAGAADQDEATLNSAVRALLRVPVVYDAQTAYVPKALFLAGRAFDMLQDDERKRDMRRELEVRFPDSPWTVQARRVF